jgi:plastocyanin
VRWSAPCQLGEKNDWPHDGECNGGTPGTLQVTIGATITWTNYESSLHSATAGDGTWDTGILNKDQHASVTFNTPGDLLLLTARFTRI